MLVSARGRGLTREGGEGQTRPAEAVHTYVVSSVKVYREALKRALAGAPGVRVGGDGGFTEATVLEIAARGVQLVLMDFTAPDALALAKALADLPAPPKVVMVGVTEDDAQVLACAEAGVAGYASCTASVDDLQRVICEAMQDKFVCSPGVTAALVRKLAQLSPRPRAAAHPLAAHLTAREKQVAALLGQGLTNKEIARDLAIGSATVRNHVHAIFAKLKVKRRAEAVAVLHVNGARRA